MEMNVTSEQLNEPHSPVNEPHSPEVRHERSDVSVSGVFIFGLVLLVSAVIIHLIVWGMLHHYTEKAAQSGRPLPTVGRASGKQTPPEPRLQIAPREDLQTMRAEEEAMLNQYGWVDRQEQRVRIPVEQAMQILVQRGLPVQPDGTSAPENPRTGAGQ